MADAIAVAGGVSRTLFLDVASEDSWRRAVQVIRDQFSRLDILVNATGVSFACPITDMTLEQWRRVMSINLEGAFLAMKYVIPAMREGAGATGSVITIAFASGVKASAGASAYSASKAAVCMLSKVAAKECLQNGDAIRINTICPAGVKTPMWEGMSFFQELVKKHGSVADAFTVLEQSAPFGRFAQPEEIAQAVLYLASDESKYITGTDIVIDGGFTA